MPRRDPILARFGLRLRQCREAEGLTQERLAESAGLDQTYISGIERGRRNLYIWNLGRPAETIITVVRTSGTATCSPTRLHPMPLPPLADQSPLNLVSRW